MYQLCFLHEVGHSLSLQHTYVGSTIHENVVLYPVQVANPYDCYGNLITEVMAPDWTNYTPTIYSTEHVTRDELNPNYNAYTAGDCVPDTSANAIGANTCVCTDPVTNDGQYIVFDEVVDIVGMPYDLNFLTTNNLMGNINQKYLTPGQGWRMRSYIENCIQYNHLIGTAINPNGLASLYYPYKAEAEVDMDNNHIISIEDDPANPGHLIVCRPQYLTHKFAKGFEYHIYKVNNGYYANGDIVDPNDATLQEIVPADANCDTKVIGTYLAVKIPAFSNDIIMIEDVICLTPVSCSSEPITFTTIFSTDNLGSANGTSQILDAQQSADPDLENNLEPQKYHNINKTTQTGATKNKTIYKN